MKFTFAQLKTIHAAAEEKIKSINSNIKYSEDRINSYFKKRLNDRAEELGIDVNEIDLDVYNAVEEEIRSDYEYLYEDLDNYKAEYVVWDTIRELIEGSTY